MRRLYVQLCSSTFSVLVFDLRHIQAKLSSQNLVLQMRLIVAIGIIGWCISSAQPTFEGQYADLLFGHIDQAYVAPRAQKVIQLLNATHAVLSGCDDGVNWWGDILANITNNGRTMFVDFSPKGGPSSVEANLTSSGHITWTGNNFWERTSYTASFAGEYTNVFSGQTLPNFPSTEQSVSISVAPFSAPNYHTTTASLTSAAWPTGTVATGYINFNMLIADFTAVGGPNNVMANLTQSGDIQWIQAENMWQRDLCAATYDSNSNDNDDRIFTQNIVLSVISFVVMLLSAVGVVFYCVYIIVRKPDPLLVQ